MRYIPATDADLKAMMDASGIASEDALFSTIPEGIRSKASMKLPEPMDELRLRRHMKALSERNAHAGSITSFLGAGTYNHFVPSVVDHMISRSEFYTAYTPYQPEISQGTLQAIFEFQTLVCQLTGLDVANASMYDGASALAEAVLMAARIKKKAKKVFISRAMHPEYRAVARTYTNDLDIEIVEIPFDDKGKTDLAWLKNQIGEDTAAVALQYPNFFGVVEDMEAFSAVIKEKDALFITATTEPVALGLLRPPGDFGVDIAVAEGQSLGNAVNFGGPHVGLFSVRQSHLRNMPGRLVGETVDQDGQRGYVLTLSTREQHIRREKATSNICSNQSLCALAFTIHLSLLGRKGFMELASTNLSLAEYTKKQLSGIKGISLAFESPTFNEFVIKSEDLSADALNAKLLAAGIIGGLALGRFYSELENAMLLCTTEMCTKEDIDRLAEVLRG